MSDGEIAAAGQKHMFQRPLKLVLSVGSVFLFSAIFSGCNQKTNYVVAKNATGAINCDPAIDGTSPDSPLKDNQTVASESSVDCEGILKDTLSPTEVSIVINDHDVYTNVKEPAVVALSLDARDEVGVTEMYITETEQCINGGVWEPFKPSRSWILKQTNKLITIHAKFRDASGNESECVNASIIHDNIPPADTSVLINLGAEETTSKDVALTLSASDASEIFMTNNPDCKSDGVWQPYALNQSWTLEPTSELEENNPVFPGQVYVVFKDAAGNDSECVTSSITVDLIPRITITTQPEIELLGGFDVDIKVSATVTQSASLNYRWQKQSKGVGEFVDITDAENHSASTDTLNLLSLTHGDNDGDVYRVIVGAGAGATEKISEEVTLDIPAATPVITIETQPTDQKAARGLAAFAVVASVTDDLPLFYQWEMAPSGSDSFATLDGETSPTLTLTELDSAAHGNTYRVLVNAPWGAQEKVSSTAVLTINPTITINKHPEDQVILLSLSSGQPASAMFAVEAQVTDDADLSYQWQKLEPGQLSFSDIPGATAAILEVNDIDPTASDESFYRVVVSASGDANDVISKAATYSIVDLDPPPKPVITINSQPQDQSASGGTATFDVGASVTQNATLSYQWQVSINQGETFVNVPDGSQSSLNLSSVTKSFDGHLYRVVVSATDGAEDVTSDMAKLIVPDIDQQPGWVVVAKFNSADTANMLTAAEILSEETIGDVNSAKYMLGNKEQSFTQWSARVNGVWMETVQYESPKKFNSDPKDLPGDSSNFETMPGLVVGRNPDGGAISVVTSENSIWATGEMPASRFAVIKYSTKNYSEFGAVSPFTQDVPDAADHNYCQFSGGGISSGYGIFGAGFGCRSCFMGSMGSCLQISTNVQTVEIWASAGSAKPRITINQEPSNQVASSGTANFAVDASVTHNAQLSYQWEVSADNGVTFSAIDGATTELLSVSGLSPASDGTLYRVVISGTDGALPVTSRAASLSVKGYSEDTGWTLVARFDSSDLKNMLTASELLSDETVGSVDSPKYMLGNSLQNFTQWVTKVNGIWMDPVTYSLPLRMNSDPSDFPVDSTNPSNVRALVIGTNADGGALSVYNASNSSSASGLTPADRFAVIKYSAASYSNGGSVFPFNQVVPGSSDNNFCSFSGGEITSLDGIYGIGFGCRSCSLGACFEQSTQVESVEVWASSGAVTPLITITQQPEDVLTSGDLAHFSVEAQATENAALTYQWERSVDGGSTFSKIIGKTSSSLLIDSLNFDENGHQYRVVVSASGGAKSVISDPATLSVLPQITVDSWPADQMVSLGSFGVGSATFEVNAAVSAGATLSFQWQKREAGTSNFVSIDGATSSVLELTGLNPEEDTGDYYRVILSADGGATSLTSDPVTFSDFILTDDDNLPEITIDTQPNNQVAMEGGATFQVEASVTKQATLTYQWQKQVRGTEDFVDIPDATSDRLELTGLTYDLHDGDVFQVVVSASDGAIPVTSVGAILTVPRPEGPACELPACGGIGNSCYLNSAAMAAGQACLSDGTQIELVQASQSFRVWKETNGNRILKATGLWSSPEDWQQGLNRKGTEFVNTPFTNYGVIAGIACPPSVFLDYQKMTANGQCVYYDAFSAPQSLNQSTGILGEDYLRGWDLAGTGNDSQPSWYEGNIKACADRAMRLPTLYETTASDPGSSKPTDAYPSFASKYSGVPFESPDTRWSWTASAYSNAGIYWNWNDRSRNLSSSFANPHYVRCVLPSGSIVITIAQQPQDQVAVNDAATFAIVARVTQSASLSYQWQRSVDRGFSYQDLEGQTGPVLSLSDLTYAANRYKYRVVVSATGGATSIVSRAANLSVKPVISIIEQPTDQSARYHDTDGLSLPGLGLAEFSISAVANAGSTLSYQWQKSSDGGLSFTNILGAKSANLVVPNLTVSQHGLSYRVVLSATGGARSIISDTASLTVIPEISISQEPADAVAPDKTASFSVMANVTAAAQLSYKWQMKRSTDDEFSDILGGVNSSLVLSNLNHRVDDQNEYRVIVSANGGALDVISRIATLTVLPPIPVISIITQPSNQQTSTQEATYQVEAFVTEEATLSYQWQKSVNGYSFSDIPSETGSSLSLAALTCADRDSYYRVLVSATGGASSVHSHSAHLSVVRDITMIEQPTDQTAVEGAANFSVGALASYGEPVSYQWERSRDEGVSFGVLNGKTLSVLSLTNLTPYSNTFRYRARISASCAEPVFSDIAQLYVPGDAVAPELTSVDTVPPNESSSYWGLNFAGVNLGDFDYIRIQQNGCNGSSCAWNISADGGSRSYYNNFAGCTSTLTEVSCPQSGLYSYDTGQYSGTFYNVGGVSSTVNFTVGTTISEVSYDYEHHNIIITGTELHQAQYMNVNRYYDYYDYYDYYEDYEDYYWYLDVTNDKCSEISQTRLVCHQMLPGGTFNVELTTQDYNYAYGTLEKGDVPKLTYLSSSYILWQGDQIDPISPTNNGGDIDSCTVTPALPPGLSFDATTCVISGMPSEVQAAASYTITPTNSLADGPKVVLSIEVVPPPTSSERKDATIYGIAGTSNYGGSELLCSGKSICPENSPWTVRSYLPIGTLYIESQAWAKVSGTVNVQNIVIRNGGVLYVDSSVGLGVLGNIYVESGGSITGAGFSGQWNEETQTYSQNPSSGNGQLVISAGGRIINLGVIHMNEKGFAGGRANADGYSVDGPGSAGAGKGYNSSGIRSASYATKGSNYGEEEGSTYGASDFWTELYLGSGGGGGYDYYDHYDYYGYGSAYYTGQQGGAGGGAVSISASSIQNLGTISAVGGSGYSCYDDDGPGSGGTIYLQAVATISNVGTISTLGGECSYYGTKRGGLGRVRIETAVLEDSPGTMHGLVHSNILSQIGQELASFAYDATQIVVNDGGKTYRLGNLSSSALENHDWDVGLTGKKIDSFEVKSSAPLTFKNSENLTIRRLAVGGSGVLNVDQGSTITIDNIDVMSSGSLVVNSAFMNAPHLSAQGGTTYINTSAVRFASVDVGTTGSATITAGQFSATWADDQYSALPAPGHGQLVLNVDGPVSVGPSGVIHMNGAGYQGGAPKSHGYSVSGPGVDGAGRSDGAYSYSSASYATQGANSGMAPGLTYGSSDFWTKLYLGSGGAGSWSHSGGAGGGAIAINSQSLKILGTISATGTGSQCSEGGRGSGGTIYLNVTSTFSNNGIISVKGGDYCGRLIGGLGRVRIDSGSLEESLGSIYGIVHSNLLSHVGQNVQTVKYDSGQIVINDRGKTYRVGQISSQTEDNHSWESILDGKSIENFFVQNSVTFNFSNSSAVIKNLTVGGGATLKIDQAVTLSVENLSVVSGASLIINSAFQNSPHLSAQGGTTYINTSAVRFASVDVGTSGSATITAGQFSATWADDQYSALPAPGHGQLVLNVDGPVSVGPSGVIHMNGAGYQGGAPKSHGYSVSGPGVDGAGRSDGAYSYSSASYATQGGNHGQAPGLTYGASDFGEELYLGSGGGGSWSYTGGAGGGTIAIYSDSIKNLGTISVNGAGSGNCSEGGQGSGGTVYFDVTSSFSNQGTISAKGGETCGNRFGGLGRVRIDSGSLEESPGSIYGIVHSNLMEKIPTQISSFVYDRDQLVITSQGKIYRFGQISATPADNHDWESGLSGKSIQSFTVANGVNFDFNSSRNLNIRRLNAVNGATAVFSSAETMSLDELSVQSSSQLVINSAFQSHPALSAQGGTVWVNSASVAFSSIDIGTSGAARITANAFNSVWADSSYSSPPAAGNGQLILQVDGDVLVGSQGSIDMNAAGYAAGTAKGHGYSISGPGTEGAGRSDGSSAHSAASYATEGGSFGQSPGVTYGAGDFWTALYLGSGGAGGSTYAGGKGGGAISIAAKSLRNYGSISASGQQAGHCHEGGPGSGGTVYVNVVNHVKNVGVISVRGGESCGRFGGLGRVRIDTQSLGESPGSIYGVVHQSLLTNLSETIDSIVFDGSQMSVWDSGRQYRIGQISANSSDNSDWQSGLSNKFINQLNVQNSAKLVFDKLVPMNIGQLFVGSNAALTISNSNQISIQEIEINSGAELTLNSAFANHPRLSAQGGTTNINSELVHFSEVNLGSLGAATLTASGFSGSWNGSAYSVEPAAGNGRLILNVDGSLVIGSQGTVHMNGRGYPGGAVKASGYSVSGPGTLGAGLSDGNSAHSSASYATLGRSDGMSPGAVYGASDFWSHLYLGSGGAGGSSSSGGSGGGAIAINAAGFVNAGSISAVGGGASHCHEGGQGSGGTVYFNISGSFKNTGTVSTRGGENCNGRAGGMGRVRIQAASLLDSSGSIFAIVDSNITQNLSAQIQSITVDTNQLVISDQGRVYRLGVISSTLDHNSDLGAGLSNKVIKSFNIQNSAPFVFGNSLGLRVDDLNIASSATVHINSAFANSPRLYAQGGTTYINTQDVVFKSVTIGNTSSATITAGGFTGEWSGASYSSTPAAGNGRLILNVEGAVNIGSFGLIHMNAAGYRGGAPKNSGYSVAGPGTGGAGLSDGDNSYSSASYGTAGSSYGLSPGALYGASDYWTQLYLGSGGAGSSSASGGAGAGAIAIHAESLTNAGTISANGGGASQCHDGGQGSGGTVYINLTGGYTNWGTVSVKGGENCNNRKGGDGRIKVDSNSSPAIAGAFIYGSGSQNSNIDGDPVTSCGVNAACDASNPWIVPAGSVLANLVINSGAHVKISSDVTIGNILIHNAGVLILDLPSTLSIAGGLTVYPGGTITGAGFSGAWSESSYSSLPSPGNGQLLLNVAGHLQNEGLIHMNGLGYAGGAHRSPGYSVDGPDSGGGGIYSYYDGGGGSYATSGYNGGSGVGVTYGANDFWSKLYLGSGGGGNDWSPGGAGGGAISISAGSLTNFGTISANGANGSSSRNGGSGGSLYFNVDGVFTNPGIMSVLGGAGGGFGRVRIDTGSLGDSRGSIDGLVHSNIANKLPQNIVLLDYQNSQFTVKENTRVYNLGTLSSNHSDNYDWGSQLSHKNIDHLVVDGAPLHFVSPSLIIKEVTVKNSGILSFSHAESLSLERLQIETNGLLTVNSSFATHPQLSVEGGVVQVNTDAVRFSSVEVGILGSSSSITAGGFAGVWNGSSYSVEPAPGQGQLILNVDGQVLIGSSGSIQMNAAGYRGGEKNSAGQSVAGPDTYGAGRPSHSYGGGASYATLGRDRGSGTGAVYGAHDFWDYLYLGSAGGGYNWGRGGHGGGALKITAHSILNRGTISANGANGESGENGGSGGTVVLSMTGSFANHGAISVVGGNGGGLGRVKIDAESISALPGSISGVVDKSIISRQVILQSQVTFDGVDFVMTQNGDTESIDLEDPGIWQTAISGKTLDEFTVSQAANMTFNSVTNLKIGMLTIRDGGRLTIDQASSVEVERIIVGPNAVLIINSPFANHPHLSADGGTTFVNHSLVAFQTISLGILGEAVITSSQFGGVWSAGAYSSTPAAGNGRLILNVDESMVVGSLGVIHMNGKGYKGGSNNSDGYSVGGPGVTGAGRGEGGQANASSGSYATRGSAGNTLAGDVYGAEDFWTELYLGSGGGGGPQSSGGSGGGAISIRTGSLVNLGVISADGNSGAADDSGAGSGGTIYFDIVGSFANMGSISAAGGRWEEERRGGLGRIRINAGALADSPGTMAGLVHSNVASIFDSHLSLLRYQPDQLHIVEHGNVFNLGQISLVTAENHNWESYLSEKNVDRFEILGGTEFLFTTVSDLKINDLIVESVTQLSSPGLEVERLTTKTSDARVHINRGFLNQPIFRAEGGITYVNVDDVQFKSVDIGFESEAVLTTNGFSGAWISDSQTYSPGPGAGHGLLVLNVTDTLNIGSHGKIEVDGKGYHGGQPGSHGYSLSGPGSFGAGFYEPGVGVSAGSYSTLGGTTGAGVGAVYGESDYWTELYLGSGGAGGQVSSGGAGGGAIFVTAGSVRNYGLVSARGSAAGMSNDGAPGSGGTIYLKVNGEFTNFGQVIHAGGQNQGGLTGGDGRTKIDSGSSIASNATIYGISGESIIDGAEGQTIDCGNGPLCSSEYPWIIPDGAVLDNLTIRYGAWVKISHEVTISNIIIEDGGVLIIDAPQPVSISGDLIVFKGGIVTGAAFENIWTGSEYIDLPRDGNGRFSLIVGGSVFNDGTIHMNGKGYHGGGLSGAGFSVDGPGTLGAGSFFAGSLGAGGSYATRGAGSESILGVVYGANDFWNEMYLGSGGSGSTSAVGGSGGGSISIAATAIINTGVISVNGSDGALTINGGSGGTVYLKAINEFTNKGQISLAGGKGGGFGRLRIEAESLVASDGLIFGLLHSDIAQKISSSIDSFDYSTEQLRVVQQGYVTNLGVVSSNTSENYDWATKLDGRNISALFVSQNANLVLNSATQTTITTATVRHNAKLSFSNASNYNVGNLRVRDTSTLILNSEFASRPVLSAQGGVTYINDADTAFASIEVGTEGQAATITTSKFNGQWSHSAYSTAPGASNGKLMIEVDGPLIIGASGLIDVTGSGYPGGEVGKDGYSVQGPGTMGAGRYSANLGGGGSYGTEGINAGGGASFAYGDSDFITSLYLGSGGGGNNATAGGAGGGALSIVAASLRNDGNILARGANGRQPTNGGSGGTLYVNVSGNFSNAGVISVAGGVGGGYGRLQIDAGTYLSSPGIIEAPMQANIVATLSDNITSVSFDTNQLTIVDQGKHYNLGILSSDSTQNQLWQNLLSGKSIEVLTVSNGVNLDFTTTTNMSVGTMTVSSANVSFRGAQTISINTVNVNQGSGFTVHSAFANHPRLFANGGTTYINSNDVSFASIDVGTVGTVATVTAGGFNGTWDSSGGVYSPIVGAGHGRLMLNVDGAVNVGAKGVIHMDGAGYRGGEKNSSGYSVNGPGSLGAGRASSNYNAGGAGSYATLGAAGSGAIGVAYGASDFWTELYLGSGAGGNRDYQGGSGGGAISIKANSLVNAGLISAKGMDGSSGGGGSGGTLLVDVTSGFSNTGQLSVAGGQGGGLGRVRINSNTLIASPGTITGIVHSNLLSHLSAASVSMTFDKDQMTAFDNGKSYNFGSLSTSSAHNENWPNLLSGKNIDVLSVNNSVHLTFNATTNLNVGIMNITSNSMVTFENAGTISVGVINVATGSTLNFNSSLANHPHLKAGGGTIYVNSAAMRFSSVELGHLGGEAVLTAGAFSGVWDVDSATYLPAPAAGHGQLFLNVDGDLTIGKHGVIRMNGFGYAGGPINGSGYSIEGPGTHGAGLATYSNNAGGGGSYATLGRNGGGGVGTVYGSADFWTHLYLGSGGGGDRYVTGGSGGGAMSIAANSVTNKGVISANGSNGSSGGGGSGGTVYINVVGSLDNQGTISSTGGSGGGYGRVRIDAANLVAYPGVIHGMLHPSVDRHISDAVKSISYGVNQLVIYDEAKYYNFGILSDELSHNYDWAAVFNDKSVDILNVTTNAKLAMVSGENISIGSLSVSSGGSVTLGNSSSISITSLNVGAGSTLTLTSSLANHPKLVAGGGSTFVNSQDVRFSSIELGHLGTEAVITASGFSGQWNADTSTYSSSPTAGNGKLILNVDGDVMIGKHGVVRMNGAGYAGGAAEAHGYSFEGPGTQGAGRYAWSTGGGASYATLGSDTGGGVGVVYGADDFWTALHLGSGGGGSRYSTGGAGGGAVSISAGSLLNYGVISANGLNGSSGGGGSGGSVYINITGSFTSSGSILAIGGPGGGAGRIGINYGIDFNDYRAVFNPIVVCDPLGQPLNCQN